MIITLELLKEVLRVGCVNLFREPRMVIVLLGSLSNQPKGTLELL